MDSTRLFVPHLSSDRSDPSDVRRVNRAVLLGLLYPNNTISRAELGRLTGLSRVAISDVVGSLLDGGIVHEVGLAPVTGKGKRATLLSINPDILRIITLDLSHKKITGALVDLLGHEYVRAEYDEAAPGKPLTLPMVEELTAQLLMQVPPECKVLGIGVATPGVVDNGVVKLSTLLDWHMVDLSGYLYAQFGIPVSVYNDAQSAMLAERLLGGASPNFMLVRIRRGIGSALLLDDQPVVGQAHAAGEIGHISLNPNGPDCPCGKRGCLEQVVTDTILRNAIEGLSESKQQEIIAEAGRYFATAIAAPVGLLDLTDVRIYASNDIFGSTFIQAAQEHLDALTKSPFRAQTKLRMCQHTQGLVLRGAAIGVLRDHMGRI